MSKSSTAGYTSSGGVVMEKITYKPLDLKKLQNKEHTITSSEEALKDVIPIDWDNDVVNGKKKVLLVDKN